VGQFEKSLVLIMIPTLRRPAPSRSWHRPAVHPVVPRPNRYKPVPQPLKHMRYAWESYMTVCIAGICHKGLEPRFVLCSDRRLENQESGGDVGFKFGHAGDGWQALIAGNFATAREFVNRFRYTLGGKTGKLTDGQVDSKIRACARVQKRKMVDAYIHSRLAVSYSYFLKNGPQAFPEDVFRQTVYEIQNPQTFEHLACELILAGYVEGHPYLYKVHSDGTVTFAEPFACIGTGASIANAALFQRKYTAQLDFKEALYYVYEAKRLSEIAPAVGPETMIEVVKNWPNKDTGTGTRCLTLVPAQLSILDEHYKKIGLQPFVNLPANMDQSFSALNLPQ
jgi:Proteasome subunit